MGGMLDFLRLSLLGFLLLLSYKGSSVQGSAVSSHQVSGTRQGSRRHCLKLRPQMCSAACGHRWDAEDKALVDRLVAEGKVRIRFVAQYNLGVCVERCTRAIKSQHEHGYVAPCVHPEIAMGLTLSIYRQRLYDKHAIGAKSCPVTAAGDAAVDQMLDTLYYEQARLPRNSRELPSDQADRDAVDARAALLGGDSSACSEATYGEIPAVALLEVLSSPLVNMTSDDAFLDIGAGLGKHVLTASLFMHARRACGIEFSHTRWEGSCAALRQYGLLPRSTTQLPFAVKSIVELVRGDAMAMDLAPFDVVFTYSLCFRRTMMAALTLQMRAMKLGSRIITASYLGLPEQERTSTFDGRFPDTLIEYQGEVMANLNRNGKTTQGMQCMKVYKVVARSHRHGDGATIAGAADPLVEDELPAEPLSSELVDFAKVEEARPLVAVANMSAAEQQAALKWDFMKERSEGPLRCSFTFSHTSIS